MGSFLFLIKNKSSNLFTFLRQHIDKYETLTEMIFSILLLTSFLNNSSKVDFVLKKMFTFDRFNKVKMNMNTILFIIGSTRVKSFNRQVAKYVENLLRGKADIKYLDFTELPFINQDKEEPVLEVVSRIRKEVMNADGLWVFSPEYNYSYPGYVKNLFDWLSRPNDPNIQNGPTAIAGKKVTITGAGGTFATKGMREKLTELFGFIKADIMKEPMTGIHVNQEAWVSDILTLSKENKEQLQKQAEAFLQFI